MRLTPILIHKKNAISAILVSLILFTTQAVQALPKAFQANYSVAKGNITLGQLNASLTYSGNRYEYLKSTKATGIAAALTGIKVTEKTDGQFAGENIVPQNYLYDQSRRNKSRIDKIHFSGNHASGSYKNKKYNLPVQPGIQDRASLELVLASDIRRNKLRLNYTVVERGKIKQYNFQKLGVEQIKTSAGTFNTQKIKVVRKGKKRETIFWLAKEIDYLPAKIRHTEKSDVITTVIKSYTAT